MKPQDTEANLHIFISALNTQLHFQYSLNDELVWKNPSQSKDIHILDGDSDFL